MKKKGNTLAKKHARHYWTEVFCDTFDFVKIYDTEMQLQYLNTICEDVLGISLETKGVPSDARRWIFPTYVQTFEKHFSDTLKKGRSQSFEIAFLSKRGRKVFVKAQLSRILHPIEETFSVKGTFHDITHEAKALKAQELYFNIAAYNVSSRSVDALYKKISDQLFDLFDISHFAVLSYAELFSKSSTQFTCFSRYRQSKSEEKSQNIVSSILAQEVIDRQNVVLIYEHRIRKLLKSSDQKEISHLPLVWGGVEVPSSQPERAILCFYSYKGEVSYSHTDLDILDFIARQASIAIERRNTRSEIEKKDAHMYSIVESSTHQIWSVDNHYRLTSFNNNFAQASVHYFNAKLPKIGEYALSSHITSDDAETVALWQRQYDKALSGATVNFQSYTKTQKGEIIWRDIFINPIHLPNSKIAELSVIANDITNKTRSEKALQESEEKFRSIFESFQDIYFRFNLSGQITMLSPSVTEVTGYTPKELIGTNICKFLLLDTKIDETFQMLYNQNSLHNTHVTIRAKNQSIPCLCNLRIQYPLDTEKGFVEGVAKDISEIKKSNQELLRAKEAAEQSLIAKRTFLANMSHEIRTPVNGIISTLSLLESTSLGTEQKEYVHLVKKSSETLLDILNDILNLSKIEAGKLELRPKPIDIAKTFEKLISLFKQQALEKNIHLHLHLSKDLPKCLEIDETRLLQVLSNLTSNAIKFSHRDSVVDIEVCARRKNRKLFLYTEIKDSGIGIPEKALSLLFQTFSQVESSMRKKFSGTGLGLAISKQLVTHMGGEIGVNSTYKKGSTFWFTIQTKKAKMPVLSKKKSTSTLKSLKEMSPRVLIVEDNKVNSTVSGKLLTQAGCQIAIAQSGDEAIHIVQKEPFDIILMDIQMPEKDGIQTTDEIRALKTDLPPIVAMTAYSMKEDRIRFLAYGLDYYLPKPIRPDLLLESIYLWVHHHKNSCSNGSKCENCIALTSLLDYLSEEQLIETLRIFEKEAAILIKSAYTVIEKQSYVELEGIMHTLKGSAGTAGALSVSKAAKKMETILKKKNYAKITHQFEQLLISFATFKKCYRALLRKCKEILSNELNPE